MKQSLGAKNRRIENSKQTKEAFDKCNNKWSSENYLDWISRTCEKVQVSNLQLTLSQHVNNQYLFNNSAYRNKILSKVGGID